MSGFIWILGDLAKRSVPAWIKPKGSSVELWRKIAGRGASYLE